MKRYKGYSFINMAGLSVGMACFILILSYVQNELSFERFHEKRDQIFRLMRVEKIEGKTDETSYMPAPMAAAIQNEFPEIIETVRMTRYGSIPMNVREKSFVENRILLADSPFFRVFSFPLKQGDPEVVLQDKHSIVLNEDIVEKYFGDEDPIGKTITYANRIDLKITGVAENVPINTDFQFDFVIPFELINEIQGFNYLESWGAFNWQIFIFAQKNVSLSEFRKKTLPFCQRLRGDDPPEFQLLHSLFLQPITQFHLESATVNYIVIFSVVAVIILLLACINFTNLAVAQSSTREKEVGMRKVIGARKSQLIRQFLGESILLSLLSFSLAIILVELIRPNYNRLLDVQLHIDYIQNWPHTFMLLGIALGVGIISGGYPAFFVSAMKPIHALQGLLRRGAKRSLMRSLLVIFQFAVSITLIIGTVIVHRQLHYIRTKNLGFNKDHIINIVLYDRTLSRNVENLKAEFLKNPRIVTTSGNYLMAGSGNNTINWEGKQEDERKFMRYFSVDADFLETFAIKLIEGRNFRKGSDSDLKQAYLLNESAVKELGWTSAVGKGFEVQMSGSEMGEVIGVVKDFNFRSLREQIQPLAIKMAENFGIVSIRVLPEDIPGTIDYLRRVIKSFAPHAPFEYYFLDSDVDELYRFDITMGTVFGHFSFLAIVIACMGLLGLTSYVIVWRTKEIGVRKVLGASTPVVVVLLIKEFAGKILVANIVAWPIAYFAMNRWLQNFAYRESINIWMFVSSMIFVFVIAIISVGYQVVKAARKNPVNSLRYE